MTDLAEFLLARIAEDEADARARLVSRRMINGRMVDVPIHEAPGAWAWPPSRVLAECEAKRYVVRMCAEVLKAFDDREDGMWPDVNRRERSHAHAFLAHLALPYADHPDYDEEWSPASRVERGVR